MKKLIFCALLLPLLCAAARAEGGPFSIDAIHVYAGMNRPYAQGYAPVTQGNVMTVVLPLLADAAVGDITATLIPQNPEAAPFKLQGLQKRISRKEYRFAPAKVNAYLVSFKLPLYSSRLNGEYPFTVEIAGHDAEGNALSQQFDLEAAVTDGRENGETPSVCVTGFDMGADFLTAGEEGRIHMALQNGSKTRAAENLTVRLADASGDILPLGADTLRLGRLAAGQSAECVIPVRIAQKAAAQMHSVEVALSYTHAGGKAATSSVKYAVDVRQPVRLEYTEASLPARVTQGDVPSLSMTLMNMGRSTLNNVLLTFNVPGLASGGSVLAGTIEPGASKDASANFRVDAAALGPASGALTISYEDPYGESHLIRLPLKTTIEKKVVQVYGKEETEEKEAGPPWLLYCVIGALLSSLAFQRVILTRKIRVLEERHL
jgi:hypothetical protein